MLTAFYMAWFFAFFCVFFALFAILCSSRHEKYRAWLWMRHEGLQPLLAFAGTFGISIIPFLHVYLATARNTGMHPYAEADRYLPSLLGIANVSFSNVFYGKWLIALSTSLGPRISNEAEQLMGMPLLLLICAAFGAFISFKANTVWRALVLATLISWLATTRLHGHPIWPFFYHYFPAAAAVRVISRYELFLAAPVTLLAIKGLQTLFAIMPRRYYAWGLIIPLCGLMTGEEINAATPLGLLTAEEDARLAAIPAPPAECSSFFTLHARKGPLLAPGFDQQYSHNVDGMFIAEIKHIPTLNGMDSFYPPQWDLAGYDSPTYLERVSAYIKLHHLQRVCALDLQTSRWMIAPSLAAPSAPRVP